MFCSSSYAQTNDNTIYLQFNENITQTCSVDIEGEGYQTVDTFRKEQMGKHIVFHICDEEFLFKKKDKISSVSEADMNKITFSKLPDLLDVYHSAEPEVFKHHLINSIYIIEQTGQKSLKYEVTWNDERLGIIE